MKKYIKPNIKAIELSPEQAVLNVCIVGGVYFGTGIGVNLCHDGTGPGQGGCESSVRGGGKSANARYGDFMDDRFNQPS
ncbi:MAG: hypothetical protein PHQ52_07710 [Candidatus Omnitrophica bacterium]|nr:hypothetical protein [Candidatus Omnitrophota bacterium]